MVSGGEDEEIAAGCGVTPGKRHIVRLFGSSVR